MNFLRRLSIALHNDGNQENSSKMPCLCHPLLQKFYYNAHVSQFSYPFSAVGLIEYVLFVDVTVSSHSDSTVTVVVAVVVVIVVVAAIVVVVVVFLRRRFVCELRPRCVVDVFVQSLKIFTCLSLMHWWLFFPLPMLRFDTKLLIF